ncbi:MAG: T9SS type A sorting domain-containing protein, partial [Candidatus Edwardsbacteria bacterium]|nr:T9SS type A sorting domain-containing protein [Candidatus Edwardsbacteria bacterium]
YPNPFNDKTSIKYQINKPGVYQLKIYDISGRLVKEILNEFHKIGNYVSVWDGFSASGKIMGSGIYLACFHNDEKTLKTRKIIKLK